MPSEEQSVDVRGDLSCEFESSSLDDHCDEGPDYVIDTAEYAADSYCKREVDPRTDNLIRFLAQGHGTPAEVDFRRVACEITTSSGWTPLGQVGSPRRK